MTEPTNEVPDADWAEQQAETEPEPVDAPVAGIPPEANEADALEQLSEVPLDEDDV